MIIPLLLSLFSCSNNKAIITTRYMECEGQDPFNIGTYVESSIDYQLEFSFWKDHKIDNNDLNNMKEKIFENMPSEIADNLKKDNSVCYGIYGFCFDLDRFDYIKEGYVLKENVTLYYSFFVV